MHHNLENSPIVRELSQHELPGYGPAECHCLKSLARKLFLSQGTVRRMLMEGSLVPDDTMPGGVLLFSAAGIAEARKAVIEEIVAAVLTARPHASEEELAALIAQAIEKQKARSQMQPKREESESPEPRNAVKMGGEKRRRQR